MDLDGHSAPARGLRRYVRLAAEAIGVGAEASVVQFDDPISAYLALDRCHSAYPDRDLALLWDERCGWALGVEASDGPRVDVLGYLATDLLPPPRVVAAYVETACRTGDAGQSAAPSFGADGLVARLADYAEPFHEGLRFFRSAIPGSFGRPGADTDRVGAA
ncbi:MAG TPA: DUF6292 family protein [Pseudonocardiaceae bacterium]|jgi:hypothetical protein|nr:DUF6292 family protein [Pseudonocardiaceae bacterium]